MQRKLTAIVAADVVNYCVHLSRNEVATLKVLNSLRRDVFVPFSDKYNGKIIRLMGDGSILVFDSALDAVRFAMETQQTIAERTGETVAGTPLEFRMGVNISDIILEEDDIHGEGVNIAVRLEELAPPGGLCLSHGIYLQTKSAVGEHLLPIGERLLKNIAEPVFVWRWHPKNGANGVDAVDPFPARKGDFRGRQILDPQVTALLVDLHMRSARLAISDAFDEMLGEPGEGRYMTMEDIYRKLGYRLNAARAMLHPIQIESVGDIRDSTIGLWQNPQSMAEFVSNVFDSASTSYAFRLLPIIQKILGSDVPPLVKRAQLLELIQTFMRDDMAPRLKSAIKFAFVETA